MAREVPAPRPSIDAHHLENARVQSSTPTRLGPCCAVGMRQAIARDSAVKSLVIALAAVIAFAVPRSTLADVVAQPYALPSAPVVAQPAVTALVLPPAPAIGTLTLDQVNDYLALIKAKGELLKGQREMATTDEERDRLRDEFKENRAFYASERDRLTPYDKDLVAGGGVVLGFGVASLGAGVVTGLLALLSGIDGGRGAESLGVASLGCLGAGVGLAAIGGPMVGVGRMRSLAQPNADTTADRGHVVGTSVVFAF